MYPGYRSRQVLDEYAIVFLSLLSEGYRQEHERYIMLANISAIPIMSKEAIDKLMRHLEWASTHPSDILKPSGDSDGMADLKKIFNRM